MASTEAKVAKIREKFAVPEDVFIAPGTNGYATFDGHFVALERVGMARLTVGKGSKRIAITSITGVQLKPAGAFTNGFIQFTVPGGSERRSAFGSQTLDAVKDENSVVFQKGDEPAFLKLREMIEQAQMTQAKAASAPPAPDVVAQLQQLGQLRDSGIITEEEFNAKKAELLGRM